MFACTADNASVHHGKYNSAYQKLKVTLKNIIAANDLACILHYATRCDTVNLEIDDENIVLKLHSHFSISPKRTEQLKEICEFMEVEDNYNLFFFLSSYQIIYVYFTKNIIQLVSVSLLFSI